MIDHVSPNGNELPKCTCDYKDHFVTCPANPCPNKPDTRTFKIPVSADPAWFDQAISDIGDPIRLSDAEYAEAMQKAVERLIIDHCDSIAYAIGVKEFTLLHQHEQADIMLHLRAIQNIIYARTAIKAKK